VIKIKIGGITLSHRTSSYVCPNVNILLEVEWFARAELKKNVIGFKVLTVS
jgi:hypothetical protein